MRKTFPLIGILSLVAACQTAQAEPTKILFVGNSYTFGRVDPVMSYNAANVDDLTRPRPDLPGTVPQTATEVSRGKDAVVRRTGEVWAVGRNRRGKQLTL